MLEAILKEVKVSSSVWQALILAGLVPAAVVCGGWLLWPDGRLLSGLSLEGVTAFVSRFKDAHDFLVREGISIALVLLIAVLFYLLRPIIQYFLKRPPLVGSFLREHQRSEKQRQLQKLYRVLWVHDSLEWHTHKFAVPDHTGQPLPVKCPKSLSRCQSARGLLSATSKATRIPWLSRLQEWERRDKIKVALFELYCVVSYAQLVRIRAYDNSLKSQSSDPGLFWASAEAQLKVQIPNGWEAELNAWHDLCASANFAIAERLKQIESDSVSLVEYGRARRILDRAPADAWLEPTALGNMLAALEEYGQTRYAIDTSSLWSRIEQIAPKEQRASVAAAKLSLETSVNLTAAFLLLAWLPLALQLITNRHAFNLIFSISFCVFALALAWISYLGTLSAAEALSEHMRAVIDVNVLSFLRGMGFQPTTAKQRKEMLDSLSGFLANGEPLPDDMQLATPPGK